MVFDVYSIGNAGRGASRRVTDGLLLLMRWHALPNVAARAVRPTVHEKWLPLGCAWAAAAAHRGNVWRGVDHRWRLMLDGDGFEVIED